MINKEWLKNNKRRLKCITKLKQWGYVGISWANADYRGETLRCHRLPPVDGEVIHVLKRSGRLIKDGETLRNRTKLAKAIDDRLIQLWNKYCSVPIEGLRNQ